MAKISINNVLRDKETPVNLVNLIDEMDSGCYERMDTLYESADVKLRPFPSYCMMPTDILIDKLSPNTTLSPPYLSEVATLKMACWLWRKHRVIYQFDPDLARQLFEDAGDLCLADRLPVEDLLSAPYPAVYIKVSDIICRTDGFFYYVDFDLKQKHPVLRIVWLDNKMLPLDVISVPLFREGRFQDCAEEYIEAYQDYYDTVDELVNDAMLTSYKAAVALQYILYINASNADIIEDPDAGYSRHHRKRTFIKTPADKVRVKEVGTRVGSVIRKKGALCTTVSTGTGSRKCPHTRKGHWHHYWIGSGQGKRRILKWLSPMYINMSADDFGANDATIYPVVA